MHIEEKLEQMGMELPNAPEGGEGYVHVKEFGDKLVYVSGCGPEINGKTDYHGRVGKEVTFEQAQECAVNCTLNILCALKQKYDNLDRIKSFVKMLAFVTCDHDFIHVADVANASTKLLVDLFGKECGLPARSAIGVSFTPTWRK